MASGAAPISPPVCPVPATHENVAYPGHGGCAPVQAARRPALWYRDSISCLQSTFAAVIAAHGHDPLEVLGAGWEFLHIPGDVRTEEFYHPCRHPGDLGRSLAPHHPLRSRWVEATNERDALSELAVLLAGGRLPIAAVDNFHLPFRPAYHDVHAAHLVVVYGVDRARGLVLVSDAMPPAFTGAVAAEHFLAAWNSLNPSDHQDAFFSSSRIGRRYLLLEMSDPFPSPDQPATLRAALQANLAGFTAEPNGDGALWSGMAGLRRYLDWVLAEAVDGAGTPVRDAYPFGWSMQAKAALHGELLRSRGAAWDVPELREAGRAVEAVAHAWTGVRITAAHRWSEPRLAAEDLEHHGVRLQHRYEAALAAVRRAVEAL
jgi:hypothetical protein